MNDREIIGRISRLASNRKKAREGQDAHQDFYTLDMFAFNVFSRMVSAQSNGFGHSWQECLKSIDDESLRELKTYAEAQLQPDYEQVVENFYYEVTPLDVAERIRMQIRPICESLYREIADALSRR